jgi:hypothetical protein
MLAPGYPGASQETCRDGQVFRPRRIPAGGSSSAWPAFRGLACRDATDRLAPSSFGIMQDRAERRSWTVPDGTVRARCPGLLRPPWQGCGRRPVCDARPHRRMGRLDSRRSTDRCVSDCLTWRRTPAPDAPTRSRRLRTLREREREAGRSPRPIGRMTGRWIGPRDASHPRRAGRRGSPSASPVTPTTDPRRSAWRFCSSTAAICSRTPLPWR